MFIVILVSSIPFPHQTIAMPRYRYDLEASLNVESYPQNGVGSVVSDLNEKFDLVFLHDFSFQQSNEQAKFTIKPFILYVDSMQLYQETVDDNDTPLKSSIQDRSSFDHECAPLLAINLPPNVISLIEEGQPVPPLVNVHSNSKRCNESNEQSKYSNEMDAMMYVWTDILPKIHPSLAYFEPIILIKSLPKPTSTGGRNLSSRGNSFDLLLLKLNINSFNESRKNGECNAQNSNTKSNKKDEMHIYNQTLRDIIEEINGERMGVSQSSVIQSLPISIIKVNDSSSKPKYEVEGNNTSSNTSSYDADETNYGLKKKPQDEEFKCYDGQNHQAVNEKKRVGIPLCPVCRFRIEQQRLDSGLTKLNQTHTHETRDNTTHDDKNNSEWSIDFLSPWVCPNFCGACHVLQERLIMSGAETFATSYQIKEINNDDRLQCFKCAMKETLWVCLTCAVIGCGRYSHGHAESHYKQSSHPFSMELATQRIWDYSTSSFVNREDLLKCTFMQDILGAVNRAAYFNASSENGENEEFCDNRVVNPYDFSDWTKPKKASVVGEEYEILLQSALEDQAQHFDLEIAHLTAQLASETVDKNRATNEQMYEILGLEKDIENLKNEVEVLRMECINIQAEEAEHRAKSNTLLREQGVSKQLLERIREDAAREHEDGKRLVEDLELQVRIKDWVLFLCRYEKNVISPALAFRYLT